MRDAIRCAAISNRYTHPSCWIWPSSASSRSATCTGTRSGASCGSTWAFWPTSRSAPSTPPSPAWRSRARWWPPKGAGGAQAAAAPAAAAPPTGSLSGERAVLRARRHSPARARRGRKVYRITDAGRALFVELLAGSGATDDARSFGLRLAFARHLAPQARLALLERRRALLVQRLGEAEAARTDLDVYARSVVQHTADGVARDISWLDTLIASERAALARPRTEPVA